MLSQLNALSEASTAPLVRSAAAKTSAAFKRCLELCEHMPSVTDAESFYSMLTAFVARIKAMEPGSIIVVPAGWRTGLVTLVLQCDSTDDFTLAVVATTSGIAHHPSRIDPITGGTQHNSPLLMRKVPAARVQDAAVWYMLLKACFFPDERHTAQLFYHHILPYFNRRPIASNIADASAAPGEDALWMPPMYGGDPHGYELASRTAATAMHIVARASARRNSA